MRTLTSLLLLTACCLLLSSESRHVAVTETTVSRSQVTDPAVHRGTVVRHVADNSRDTAKLRFIVHRAAAESVTARERALLLEYAREQGKQPEWVEVTEPWHRLRYLHEGRGDVVVSASTDLDNGSRGQVRYTLPWAVVTQYVIGRRDTGRIDELDDLATRVVALKKSSPVWSGIAQLAQHNPAMAVIAIPEQSGARQVLARVESGQYDLVIGDSLSLQAELQDFPRLEVMYDLAEVESLVWAVHPDALALQQSLNRYLHKKHLQHNMVPAYSFDLPELEEKRVLRVITYKSPVNYYLDNGRLKGFEYELLRRFAESRKMRLDVVLADSHAELKDLLVAGRGDIIAAFLPDGSFAADRQLAATLPYNYSAPVVVGRQHDSALISSAEMQNRRIVLPGESPWGSFLGKLQPGAGFELRQDNATATTESTLFRVAHGMYDLTVIGSHELASQFARQLNLRAHFALSGPLPQSWYVRSGNTLLRSALDDFIEKNYRKGFYNVLYSRYVEKPTPPKGDSHLLAGIDRLSPYDEIVHHYADKYDFDWRLIVAQMYQESQFDPEALSYAGAEGLMQLIPDTAELMGISDVNDPQQSIRAGVGYLKYLRGKFEQQLQPEDRTWFTLASYNAGYGRVHRARELAVEMGLDPDRWFDNVERAMQALAKPYWRDGQVVRDCRCGQAVVYVRDIKTLYNNYIKLTGTLRSASNASMQEQDI